MRCFLFGLVFLVNLVFAKVLKPDNEHSDPSDPSMEHVFTDIYHPDWETKGKQDLEKALNVKPQWNAATNVILFIGDGMGISTLTAARFFKAQYINAGTHISNVSFSWEDFPSTGIIKTYSTNQQATDSAASASAIMCGEKTKSQVTCVKQTVEVGDCEAGLNNPLKSMLHHAMDDGKWTGIISTARVNDATPSTAYANSALRSWYNDADVPPEYKDICWDISRQLIDREDNKNIKVVLGGGRRDFYTTDYVDPESGELGRRQDGRNLSQDWLAQKESMGVPPDQFHYVEKKSDFDAVNPDTEQYLLGLFESHNMHFEADRLDQTGEWTEPSLTEMVDKTLKILQRGPNGYFMFVEGGRIDHAHHDNNAYKSLYDTVAFDNAVQRAIELTNVEDTLIVVTADHSHMFTIAGDAHLENDILGISVLDDGSIQLANDNKPFTVLSYANGPGFYKHRTVNDNIDNEVPRVNLTQVNTSGKNFLQDSSVPRNGSTHAAEDVAIFAQGPMSHLLTGLHEQSYIYYAVSYAACLGDNKEMCDSPRPVPGCPVTDHSIRVQPGQYIIVYVLFSWTLISILTK